MSTSAIAVPGPLWLLVGSGLFVIGFFTALQVTTALSRRRDKLRAQERRALNAVWRYLHEQYGIQRPSWLHDDPPHKKG
ncbi:hypothetical protein [Amycolatopsis minnesotensis]|uniref:Uncharacterized protein n=1 Tax=Amycolatopsis minnesotensis TaxID=337894 RepID=A0ABP5EEL3_9PSEU